ncbi:formin-like protein 5 [Iris pallida]|uniref:Formin-like protein 5 n=1 Tax=Iris pallida TaxID=29817 RepID=A0AAX6FSK3_IRIPA|nr:formin-like protein 5 [Iris pallida]
MLSLSLFFYSHTIQKQPQQQTSTAASPTPYTRPPFLLLARPSSPSATVDLLHFLFLLLLHGSITTTIALRYHQLSTPTPATGRPPPPRSSAAGHYPGELSLARPQPLPPRSTSPPSPPPHRIRHHHHPFIQRLRQTTLDVLRRRAHRHWPYERRPSPYLRVQPRTCEDNSYSSSDHRQQRAPPCRTHRRCSAAVDGHAPPWAATHRRGRPPHGGRSPVTPLGPLPRSPVRRIGDSCVLHDVPS